MFGFLFLPGSILYVYISTSRIITARRWSGISSSTKLWKNSDVPTKPFKGTTDLIVVHVSIQCCSLQMCLNSVAELFASITRYVTLMSPIPMMTKLIVLFSQLELVFCYTVLEQNKRLLLLPSQTSQPLNTATSDNVTTNHPLDTFFPFDPYQLRRSVGSVLLWLKEESHPQETRAHNKILSF